MDFPHNCSHRL